MLLKIKISLKHYTKIERELFALVEKEILKIIIKFL